MTEKEYKELLHAQKTLCHFCENDECEKCIVTSLMDSAYAEADKAGIIDTFAENDETELVDT